MKNLFIKNIEFVEFTGDVYEHVARVPYGGAVRCNTDEGPKMVSPHETVEKIRTERIYLNYMHEDGSVDTIVDINLAIKKEHQEILGISFRAMQEANDRANRLQKELDLTNKLNSSLREEVSDMTRVSDLIEMVVDAGIFKRIKWIFTGVRV